MTRITESSLAQIDAKLAAFVLPFAASEDVRYYLNGIYIAPSRDGGVIIAATDGHMMFCARDPDGIAERAIILPLQKKNHSAVLRKADYLEVLADGSFRCLDRNTGVTWISPHKETDGKFPDIFRLVGNIQEWQEGLIGAFNPEYLQRAMQCAPKSRYRGIRFFHRGESPEASAALFTISHPPAFGIVMPMRFDDRENGLANIIPSEFKAEAA